MATNIIIMLKEGASLHFNKNDIAKGVDWLKSLKERVQPKQEWGEKDEEMIHCLEYTVKHFYEDKQTIVDICSWLKSLRPQNQCGYNPYKESIVAIKEMIGKYHTFDVTDLTYLRDLVNNILVKCKDAIEYDNLHP